MVLTRKHLLREQVWENFVNRLCQLEKLERQHGERIANETLLFLEVCARNSGRRFTPSEDVDKGWHVLLQFTKEYRALCGRLGGSMIDHTPPRSEDEADWLHQNFRTTVNLMAQQATGFDPSLWEAAATSICGCED
jgi:hypothetical protein